MYISGFTNISTGEVVIDSKYYDLYNMDELYFQLVKPILHQLGVTIEDRYLSEALCKLPKEYKMDVDVNLNRILLKRESIKAGYIYNSKKETILYSFFFEKVSEEGNVTCDAVPPSVVSEIEEIEKQIVNEITFINELKEKIKEPVTREIYEEPSEVAPVKTQFQIELEKEVDLREQRKKVRDRKINKKKEKRARRLE
jgi:hypothetical protein